MGTRLTTTEDGTTDTCVSCRGLFRSRDTCAKLKSEEGLVYRRSLISMQPSAEGGCIMCQELLNMDLSMQERRLRGEKTRKNFLLRRTLATFTFRGHLEREQHIRVTRSLFFGDDTDKNIEVTTPYGDVAEKHICTQSPNLDPQSDYTFGLIRNWLQECEYTHSKNPESHCQALSDSPLPTRVLQLWNDQSVRLVNGKGIRAPYVALSYCWGGEQPHALVMSNIDMYRDDIPMAALPRSIKDAILVTNKLGIRYLWVDSLCIIQDSIDDKDSQMALMGNVYGNAYLTISAAGATSCHDGFLQLREEQRCIITLPFCCDDGEIGKISLWIRVLHEPRFAHGASEPLDSRAWALQERFMSHRLLIFSQLQVFFVCGVTFGSDGGTVSKLEYTQMTRSEGDLRRQHKMEQWHDFNGGSGTLSAKTIWKALVAKDFSQRQLSNPEDKLPAVSSIAAYISNLRNDEKYLAGLWSGTLLEDLAWRKAPGKTLTRSTVWRCPSWSYMSVDGEITFLPHKKSLVDILECLTTPTSADAPFGRVKSGTLSLKGHIIKVNPLKPLKEDEGIKFWRPKGRVTTPLGTLYYDTTDPPTSAPPFKVITNHGKLKWSAPVYCLIMGLQSNEESHKRHSEDIPWGVVLAKSEDRNYHRVGWFKGKSSSLAAFRDKSKKLVTII